MTSGGPAEESKAEKAPPGSSTAVGASLRHGPGSGRAGVVASRGEPGGATDSGSGSNTDETEIGHSVRLDDIMARAGSENFPVALWMLPRRIRQHLWAVYGYARLVDCLGDEYPGDRATALDWAEKQLDALFAGTPRHPVFRRLAPTVQHLGLSRTPFDRLLAANRLDQRKTRYADWEELLGYCELSANPVGHLVLGVFKADTPERLAASDDVCSGLQVLEHLQDVREDAQAGRVYLPAEDMDRFGVSFDDLLAEVAGPSLRSLVAHEAGRARKLLDSGRGLSASLRGHARIAVTGFTAGGLAGIDAIEAAGSDVLGGLRKAGRLRLLHRFADVCFKPAPSSD